MATTNSDKESTAEDTEAGGGAEKAESSTKAEAEGAADEKAEKAEAGAEKAEEAPAKPKPATRPAARAAGPRPAAARPGGGLGGLVPIALVVGVAVVLGYVVLRGDGGSSAPAPGAAAPDESQHWSVGQTVELDITLKPTDRGNLSCASPDEVAGKHCAFDAPDKPSAKGNNDDDKKILKPYAVPNSPTRVLVAGLWTDPGMSGKLPDERFTAHCKVTIEGKVNSPSVRWDPKGPWRDMKAPWFAGSASGCAIKK
jgi:hypothetical protein